MKVFSTICLCLVFLSCLSLISKKKNINPASVQYIVIHNKGTTNFRTLSKAQQQKFVEDWNHAKAIGSCIFITRHTIEVVDNQNLKRTFQIAGSNIKELQVNDDCFDVGDSIYFSKLWDSCTER